MFFYPRGTTPVTSNRVTFTFLPQTDRLSEEGTSLEPALPLTLTLTFIGPSQTNRLSEEGTSLEPALPLTLTLT